jgi:hypothetical protein
MDILDQQFQTFERSAFRLELRDRYEIPAKRARIGSFLDGQPLPDQDAKDAWMKFIRNSLRLGKSISRVHVLPVQLTPYLRYEIEWGYLYTATAGESIHLVQFADASHYLAEQTLDYWLFDDNGAVLMHYHPDGRFLKSQIVDDPQQIAKLTKLKYDLLTIAVPLRQYLRRQRNA